MKKFILAGLLLTSTLSLKAQDVLHLTNGSIVSVQNGVELNLQGGIRMEQGSLLLNHGKTRLLNNSFANQSNWTDLSSLGALGGSGLVVFNSSHLHEFSGKTNFYKLQMNASGHLSLNDNLNVNEQIHLISGKINTGSFSVFLNNSAAASLLNDLSNAGYTGSWVNGNLRRLVASNTDLYDFPVGSAQRSQLLQFINQNISGIKYLQSSFGAKPGTDAGLFELEAGMTYTGVNIGGVWYLSPDAQPNGGSYALQLFFNGFTGLTDNQFGILRRADGSSNAADWVVPSGSAMEPLNGLGRLVIDGFARRINLTNFSQWGIGMTEFIPTENGVVACTYGHGYYGNKPGMACYETENNAISISTTNLMLQAFGTTTAKVFGNVFNKQFFTLYKTDIQNGNIFKMLPGIGNSLPLGVDHTAPFDGAYYADQNTWSLVPIPRSGSQKGRINNLLLAQTMALWFNLQTSAPLASVDLSNHILITTAQTSCGSGIAAGNPQQFVLPFSVVQYLNGPNGYPNNVQGLFQLANDVLGGVINSPGAPEVQAAVAAVNNAFHGCRILTGSASSVSPAVTRTAMVNEKHGVKRLIVSAYPNPYKTSFSLRIQSPVSGKALIQFFTPGGSKIYETSHMVAANSEQIVPYKGPLHKGMLMYKLTIGDHMATGIAVNPN